MNNKGKISLKLFIFCVRDSQNVYFNGLLRMALIKSRRSRKPQMKAKVHERSYFYKIRVKQGEPVKETAVCYKAFLSIHGITAKYSATTSREL